jgi:sugar/nucleoside kinase (ribokinase family)
MGNLEGKKLDVACAGMICADVISRPVDAWPERGKLATANNITMSTGGCASNASIDLARLGARSALLGRVGDDGFGSFITDMLKSEKVDTRGVKVADTPSSVSMLTVGTDGERSVLHYVGANGVFSYDDINHVVISEAKILFIAGTLLLPALDGAGTEALLREAKETGALCCMDTAWDDSGGWLKKIEHCLEFLDWFMPSYDEAVEMSGEKDLDRIASVFMAKGTHGVVIKLGGDGCYVRPQGERSFILPAFQGVPVVDTAGAGDAFCAGFLYGVAQDWSIRECAKFGNAVGACCIMKVGTTAGVRPLEETFRFIKENEKHERGN